MITREQIYTMLTMKKKRGTLFSNLPIDLIREISDYGQNPNSEIATALKHAAYARQEDVEALLALLDKNPRLLLQAGTVQTPAGHVVQRVTIYEFLLGAGDAELAGMVQAYFAKIDHGEQERVRQYERYRPHIEGMLTQKPYDLLPLIELIKKATPEQVTALLNKDMTGTDDLCKAFIQFRKDWAPQVLTKPCMHYNYASLKHAIELLDREWDNLYKAGHDTYDKNNLVWLQLIGFEMIRLPGIDRCVMAQGLYYVVKKELPVARTYKFKYGSAAGSTFPVAAADDSIDALSGVFEITTSVDVRRWEGLGRASKEDVEKLISNKNFKLSELMQPNSTHQPSPSVIL